jgi:hypothetical protein
MTLHAFARDAQSTDASVRWRDAEGLGALKHSQQRRCTAPAGKRREIMGAMGCRETARVVHALRHGGPTDQRSWMPWRRRHTACEHSMLSRTAGAMHGAALWEE